MSCGKCKYQRWYEDGMSPDYCATSAKQIITPEGVSAYVEMTAMDALKKFRKENDGKCPHFVQRCWLDVFSIPRF